jgi:hypothetical protein
MKTSNRYQWDHLFAKVIVFSLYLLVGVVSIETNNPYLTLTVGTPIWLFGVNSVAYILECLGGHPHNHNRI